MLANPVTRFDELGLYPQCRVTSVDFGIDRWSEKIRDVIAEFTYVLPELIGPGAGPNLDLRTPKKPSLKPTIRIEWWEMLTSIIRTQSFAVSQAYLMSKFRCSETVLQGCEPTEITTYVNTKKPISDPLRELIDSNIDVITKKNRLLAVTEF